MIRDDIKAAQIAAMKGGDKAGTAAIRLIQSAIKNRDIEARTGKAPESDDALVVEVLQKMVKQRRESIEMYVKGGRQELADARTRARAVTREVGQDAEWVREWRWPESALPDQF